MREWDDFLTRHRVGPRLDAVDDGDSDVDSLALLVGKLHLANIAGLGSRSVVIPTGRRIHAE